MSRSTADLVLKAGKERSLRRRHPWVFSGAVDRVAGPCEPGDTARVVTSDGSFVAWAAYSPASQIVARVWSFDEAEPVDEAFFGRRIAAAASARSGLTTRTDAMRLVFAESDGLPGVVVDRYGGVAVMELTTSGAERWREALADAVLALGGIASVYERSDVDVRAREGLESVVGVVRGAAPPGVIEIHEDGLRFGVDVYHGHKTGFYLDQREARSTVRSLASGRRVLNVFGYTGGFSVAALAGGAETVVTIDSSGPSLLLAAGNLERNGYTTDGLVEADAFGELRRLRDAGAQFDLVIVDPPKLVHRQHQVDRGARAYKDLNWLACRLLSPGGVLVTFSCSGLLSTELHQKIVADAALDAHRDVQIIGRLQQASDHPVLLSFPESQYLKGLICRAA